VRNRSARTLPTAVAAGAAGLPQSDLLAAIPRLRRYAAALTRNAARADDLVQETLARAWEKQRQWHAGSDLRAWMFTIMHSVHINQCMRTRREAGNVSLDTEGERGAAWEVAEPNNQLDHIELREVLQQVERLPSDQRQVLFLAAVEQLHYGEIATRLGIPIGTVMSRLSRARNKLRGMA